MFVPLRSYLVFFFFEIKEPFYAYGSMIIIDGFENCADYFDESIICAAEQSYVNFKNCWCIKSGEKWE